MSSVKSCAYAWLCRTHPHRTRRQQRDHPLMTRRKISTRCQPTTSADEEELMKSPRIAILGFAIESNRFAPVPRAPISYRVPICKMPRYWPTPEATHR
jgi:hypothetical protein